MADDVVLVDGAPVLRRIFEERQIQQGPECWRHLSPGSVTVRSFTPEDADGGIYLTTYHFDREANATDEFPRSVFADRLVWWTRKVFSVDLKLYWKKAALVAVLEAATWSSEDGLPFSPVLGVIENASEVFRKVLPDLLVWRVTDLHIRARECLKQVEAHLADAVRLEYYATKL
jgi:hypothetical protein